MEHAGASDCTIMLLTLALHAKNVCRHRRHTSLCFHQPISSPFTDQLPRKTPTTSQYATDGQPDSRMPLGAALSPEMGVFAPPSPFFKNVSCVREIEFLVEHQPPQGVFVCDHAGFVINKFSLPGLFERSESSHAADYSGVPCTTHTRINSITLL